MSVAILPVLNISSRILSDLKEDIGNTFLSRVDVLPPITALPEETYDKQREQYDAAMLMAFLDYQTRDLSYDKIIAVSNIDIFMNGMTFIFGVAQKGGHMCIVSLYRLDERFYSKESSYDRLKERAVKEAIHELSHCYGLDHCNNKKCIMTFSNHVMSVDEKSRYFCDECREILKRRL